MAGSRVVDAVARSAQAGAALAVRTGCFTLLERMAGSAPGQAHVLTYHRIAELDPRSGLYPGLISATPREFEIQMQHLASSGRVIAMADLLAAAKGDRSLPAGSVLLTFDDAYADFATNVWPVLERFGLPGTLFVPTGYPDGTLGGFWWDRLYGALQATGRRDVVEAELGAEAGSSTPLVQFRMLRSRVKSLPHQRAMEFVAGLCARLEVEDAGCAVLDWDQLRDLARRGVSLCPHTRSHPLMTQIGADEMAREVGGSIEDLRREIGDSLPVFAFPSGAANDAAADVLESLGVELAFTTQRGVADLGRHRHQLLPRLAVGRRITLPVLRAQLLPQFAQLNPLWARQSHA